MLATLGKGARIEQSVHLQLSHWDAAAESATFSSKTGLVSELFNRKEQRQLPRSAS